MYTLNFENGSVTITQAQADRLLREQGNWPNIVLALSTTLGAYVSKSHIA